jgi:hypothetical protein
MNSLGVLCARVCVDLVLRRAHTLTARRVIICELKFIRALGLKAICQRTCECIRNVFLRPNKKPVQRVRERTSGK